MDMTRDVSGQQLNRLANRYGAPDFVKQAADEDFRVEGRPDPAICADPSRGLFQCHTAAATWASAAFFLEKQAAFRPGEADIINERLDYFANVHGITNAINELRTKKASIEKQASTEVAIPDEDYGLVIKQADGTTLRRYPLRHTEEVKAAAAYLVKHRDDLIFDHRRDFADRILQKAASMGVNLGEHTEYVTRQAGYGAGLAKEACEMLLQRVQATRGPSKALSNVQVELLKLAQTFAEHPSKLRDSSVRVKLAGVVDAFDREYKLHRQYGEYLKRPEDVLFELTNEKMASAVSEHVSNPQTGSIYKLADLESLRVVDLQDALGDELTRALTSDGMRVDSDKAASIIPTLDRGSAYAFDAAAAERGVQPIAKEAGAGYRFDRESMTAFAELYNKHN
jgi:hypothetical protein